MFKSIKNSFRRVFLKREDNHIEEPSNSITEEEKTKVISLIKKKRDEELNKPPTIAIIGKTGVGKSSTINSLFSTNLGVSHFESCTQKATPVVITNDNGEIIIYDMPGLGEDIEKDEQHKKEYKSVLPKCDVVLWIMNISDREMSSQQLYIKNIMTYLEGRLVICANKADKVHPENWNTKLNTPSSEQYEILEKRINDIRSKLRKICPKIDDELIVYYSATKRYKLEQLFGSMLSACPKDRGWVLGDRIKLADYTELIDKEILNKLNYGK